MVFYLLDVERELHFEEDFDLDRLRDLEDLDLDLSENDLDLLRSLETFEDGKCSVLFGLRRTRGGFDLSITLQHQF